MPHQPARLTLVVGTDQYLMASTRMSPEGALDLAAALVAAAHNEASKPALADGLSKVAQAMIDADIMSPAETYSL